MMAPRSSYSAEYKKEMVRLVTELGKKPADVARDIGVTPTSVRRWVKQYTNDGEQAFPGKGHLRLADKEHREILKKIKDLEEENAILKKAMAIFSKNAK